MFYLAIMFGTVYSVYQIVKATKYTLQKVISLGSDTWQLDVPRITLFLRNTSKNQYNYLSYISFKIAPLWNYTLLPATVKVLETFLKAVLWKPFQLFRRILNISTISKEPSLQCWFQLRQQIKASWSQVRIMEDVPVLSHCFLLTNT
jgi:hypothetical protein